MPTGGYAMGDQVDPDLLLLQLKAKAFEHHNEALFVTDHANRIVVVNPAFSRMTG